MDRHDADALDAHILGDPDRLEDDADLEVTSRRPVPLLESCNLDAWATADYYAWRDHQAAREPFIGDLDDTWNDNDEEAGDE